MKRFLLLTFIFIFALQNLSVSADNYQKDAIEAFTIPYEMYQQFIDNPSIDFLRNNPSIIDSFLYKDDTTENNITIKYCYNGISEEICAQDGEYKIGHISIYTSLLDDISNGFPSLLTTAGIFGDVNYACIFTEYDQFLTVWLVINNSNYFVTIDERYEDYAYREDKSSYVYRIYSEEQYIEKFSNRDIQVVINDENVTGKHYAKSDYTGAYLSLRSVFEDVGITVEWNTDIGGISLIKDNKKYILYPIEGLLVNEFSDDNLFWLPVGGSTYYYTTIINGTTILNFNAMKLILSFFKTQAFVDYDNMEVQINTQIQ